MEIRPLQSDPERIAMIQLCVDDAYAIAQAEVILKTIQDGGYRAKAERIISQADPQKSYDRFMDNI
jgi:hypothetical protein